MEVVAKAKFIRGSARKFRLTADMIRNKPIALAISLLHDGLTNKASKEIERVLRCAVANVQSRSEGADIDIEDLKVKSIFIDVGPTLKRGRARAQGRFYRRLRRSSHITVIVSDQ